MNAQTAYWITLFLICLGSIGFGLIAGIAVGEVIGRAKALKELNRDLQRTFGRRS